MENKTITKIYVDADACPVVNIIEKIARKYNIPVTLLCDTSHALKSDYSEVIIIEAGIDAVDYALIKLCKKGDIVVTQDYGVAAMALGKKSYAIHHSGVWYTNDNIDRMLLDRHLARKARRTARNRHINGTKHFHNKMLKKRNSEDDVIFEKSFIRLVESALSHSKEIVIENKEVPVNEQKGDF